MTHRPSSKVQTKSDAIPVGDRLPDWKLAYRVDEASAAIGIGRTLIFEKIKKGQIRARKAGKLTLIMRADLQAYLDSLPFREVKLTV